MPLVGLGCPKQAFAKIATLSKIPGAVGVGPTDLSAVASDARNLSIFKTGSQARVIANNPFIPPKNGGNMNMLDFLPEAARITQKNGEIILNGNNANPYIKNLPSSNELEKIGLEIQYQGDIISEFKGMEFRRTDGSLMDMNTMKTIIFKKVK